MGRDPETTSNMSEVNYSRAALEKITVEKLDISFQDEYFILCKKGDNMKPKCNTNAKATLTNGREREREKKM